jgi:uncharacterized membrane protein
MKLFSGSLFIIGISLVLLCNSSSSYSAYLAILLMFGSLVVSLWFHIKEKDKQSKTKRNLFG